MSYEAIVSFYSARIHLATSGDVAIRLALDLNAFLSLEGCYATNIPAYKERRPSLTQ